MTRARALIFLLCVLLCLRGRAMADVSQNAKIVLDEANHLVFEDVGRVEGPGGGIIAGQSVRLHVTRDNKQYEVDLSSDTISSEMNEIRYVDRDRIWMVAREGHLWNKAVLFDLDKRKVVASYVGGMFTLSPGAGKIAYIRENARQRTTAVFVGYTMVYPVVETGYVRQNYDFEAPWKLDGTSYREAFKKADLISSRVTGDLAWTTSSTLSFKVQESSAGTEQARSAAFTITGITGAEDEISTATVRVKRAELAVLPQ